MTYKKVASDLVIAAGTSQQIEYSQPVRMTGANAVQAVLKTLYANPASIAAASAYVQSSNDLENWTDRATVAIGSVAATAVVATALADAWARLRYVVPVGATIVLAADMNTYEG